jgi:hypothetical protein
LYSIDMAFEWDGGDAGARCETHGLLLRHLYIKNDDFTKTGSGQTQGKHSKKKATTFMHAGSWVVRTIGQCCFKYHYPDCNTSFSEGYTAADGVVNLVIKNDLFEPFIYKRDHFTKTGSERKIIGKALKNRVAFCAQGQATIFVFEK